MKAPSGTIVSMPVVADRLRESRRAVLCLWASIPLTFGAAASLQMREPVTVTANEAIRLLFREVFSASTERNSGR